MDIPKVNNNVSNPTKIVPIFIGFDGVNFQLESTENKKNKIKKN